MISSRVRAPSNNYKCFGHNRFTNINNSKFVSSLHQRSLSTQTSEYRFAKPIAQKIWLQKRILPTELHTSRLHSQPNTQHRSNITAQLLEQTGLLSATADLLQELNMSNYYRKSQIEGK